MLGITENTEWLLDTYICPTVISPQILANQFNVDESFDHMTFADVLPKSPRIKLAT